MLKKLSITLLSIFLLTFNANAGSDGEINLNQGQSTDVKDCFEKLKILFVYIFFFYFQNFENNSI